MREDRLYFSEFCEVYVKLVICGDFFYHFK